MKEVIDELLSDFKDAPKANTDIHGSIFILNETKSKIESGFIFRNLKAGVILIFELFFWLILIIQLIISSFFYSEISKWIGKITAVTQEFDTSEINELNSFLNYLPYFFLLIVIFITTIIFMITRFFRRARKRIYLHNSICNNLNQVILNLKEYESK